MRRFKLGGVVLVTLGTIFFASLASMPTEAIGEPRQLTATAASTQAKAADTVYGSLVFSSSTTPVPLAEGGTCPKGMLEIKGDYCPRLEQACLRWLDPKTQRRCAEFASTSTCRGKPQKKHFCIDEFEYPNHPGEKPEVMVTWLQAKATCDEEGRRLCDESEWTLACEGQERLPYPYGYARDAEACNIDKPHSTVNEAALANPPSRDAEAARLDQRDPSGARDACVSPYGVHDMTGNVDEWVVNESGKPWKSGLKGGYWGRVRDRCRPLTSAHGENFAFYQIGFRCCAPPSEVARR